MNRKIVDVDGETVYYKWPATNRFSLGISLYDKNNVVWTERSNVYKASAFDKATGWSRFLDKNLQNIDPEVNPVNTSILFPSGWETKFKKAVVTPKRRSCRRGG